MSVRPFFAVLLLLAPALAAAGCLDAGASPQSYRPLPLDPLTDEEEARAVRIALEDPAVGLLLATERHRVIGAALRTDKDLVLADPPRRLADVHVYRYGSDDVAWPVVDLDRGVVVSWSLERFQPRLTQAEVAEAEAALLSDPRVVEALGGDASGVRTSVALRSGGALCPFHRCVEAHFIRADEPVGLLMATYDLSARVVVHVADLAQEAR